MSILIFPDFSGRQSFSFEASFGKAKRRFCGEKANGEHRNDRCGLVYEVLSLAGGELAAVFVHGDAG